MSDLAVKAAVLGVVVLVVALAVAGAAVAHILRKHGPGPTVWRWLSGHALDGVHRTNATWTRPGTRALHPTGHAVRWHHLPRLYRAAIRTGATLGALLVAGGLVAAPAVTLIAAATAAAAATAFGLWKAARATLAFRFSREHVRPLSIALGTILGAPPAIEVARDRSTARVALPEGFSGAEGAKTAITAAVTAKTGIEAPEPEWSTGGHAPFVTFTRSEPPPSDVTWSDVQAAVAAADPDTLIVGAGKKGAMTDVSLASDAPHLAISMGSGAGKSVLAMFLVMQELRRGAIAAVIDPKWTSQAWLMNLPNVAYARRPAEIHDLLCWLGAELDRRNEVALAGVDVNGNVSTDVGPRILVICEELGLAMSRLPAHWAEIRRGIPDAPKKSPAVTAFGDVAYAGRAVRMHAIAIAQMLTARVSGGGDVRENMGVRLLSRYTANAWRMLAPEHPMPAASAHPGRIQVVTSGGVRETQVPLLANSLARQLAMSGTVTSCPAGMPGASRVSDVPGYEQIAAGGSDLGIVRDFGAILGPPAGAVRLAEAVDAGLFSSLAAAQKASTRDPAFPEPAGRRGNAFLYDISDLLTWQSLKVKVSR